MNTTEASAAPTPVAVRPAGGDDVVIASPGKPDCERNHTWPLGGFPLIAMLDLSGFPLIHP